MSGSEAPRIAEATWRNAACCVPDRRLPEGEAEGLAVPQQCAGALPIALSWTELGAAAAVGSAPPARPACDDPALHPATRLREGWADLLGRYRWDWFCTFTFDPSKHSSPDGMVHPEKAFKAFRFWINILNCAIYGRRWKQRGQSVYWVLGFERHRSNVIHLHALIGDFKDLNIGARRLSFLDIWHDNFGYAKVEVPKDADQVNRYVTKYVTKGGEIELSDNLGEVARQLGLELRGARTK